MIQRLFKTLGATLAATAFLALSAQAQISINEAYVSHSGTDFYEYIELKGPAGTSLTNYVVCVVEGDYGTTGTNPGTLDRGFNLTGHTIPASGYFVLGSPNLPTGGAPYTANFVFTGGQDTLENGVDTFYLVLASSAANATTLSTTVGAGGQIGADIDALNAPDDDLVTTIPTLGTIVDSFGLADCTYFFIYPATGACGSFTAGLSRIYDGATVIGPDGNCDRPAPVGTGTLCAQGGFLPGGIFRGLDAPNPWCPEFLDFNEAANSFEPRTPGALNSVCPSAASIVNYCTSGTTTNGCNATMGYSGTPSVAATSGFTVTVNSVEGVKQGIIFYGNIGPVASPWGLGGNSWLCVKSPTQRTGTQNTGGTAGACNGQMSLDLLAYLAANPSAVGNPFSAGQQCWIQGWFRDPPAVKTTSLSDGLEVTFQP